jgi:5-methylcytosine-specific restriction endonuclease McrA
MKKVCVICSKSLSKRQTKYCSNPCQVKGWKLRNRDTYLAGKKAYRDKNRAKINEYNKALREQHGVITDSLRKRARKDQTCLRCGTRDNLNAHHIKPKRLGGDDTMSNLTVLCFDCHMQWHKQLDEKLREFWRV